MTATLQAETGRSQQKPPAIWLRSLWERMVAMYGHAWTSVHGLSPQVQGGDSLTMSGSTWAGALEGLSGQQIANGVRSCIAEGKEFPPSAPRFRAMCIGIPSLAAIRSELRKGATSRFARAVLAEMDVFRFQQADTERSDRMVRDAYELVQDRVMNGEPLPDVPAALIGSEEHELKPATPEQREAHCAEIRGLLGLNK